MAVTGNLTEMLEQYYVSHDANKARTRNGSPNVNDNTVIGGPSSGSPIGEVEAPGAAAPGGPIGGIPKAYLVVAGTLLAAGILVTACTAALLVRRGRRKVALLHKHTALVAVTGHDHITHHRHAIGLKDLKLAQATNTMSSVTGSANAVAPPARSCPALPRQQNDDSDSESSSIYHEPYKLLPQTNKRDMRTLLKKDNLMPTSKSLDYGEFVYFENYFLEY